jgi:hypothetical protein
VIAGNRAIGAGDMALAYSHIASILSVHEHEHVMVIGSANIGPPADVLEFWVGQA